MRVAWSAARAPVGQGSPRSAQPTTKPCVSVGVSKVLPGLDEKLYQEAETRRSKQLRREEEEWMKTQEKSKPRLGRNSRALCLGRLERELREAFEMCAAVLVDSGDAGNASLMVPREQLWCVLDALGLLSGAEGEHAFCQQVGLLLDKEDSGSVSFNRLLDFFLRALDPGRNDQSRRQIASLEEDCLRHLEQQLSKAYGRLLTNRLSRPKVETNRRASSLAAGSSREDRARSASPRRCPDQVPQLPMSHNHIDPRIDSQHRPTSARRSHSAAGRQGNEARALSRCDLLYHQAIFAARESAQLEEEIRVIKEREEMRECTFRPKLMPSRRVSYSMAQPRNFESAVSRMRTAHRQREMRREENERIPAGENYERLRRLGVQPFSVYYRDRVGSTRAPPLMYVDVNVGRGRTGRIGVHEGDDLQVVAQNFAKAYQLDRDATRKLEEMLQQAYEDQTAAMSASQAADEDGMMQRIHYDGQNDELPQEMRPAEGHGINAE